MVVISIISLLSSIIFASISSARIKASDLALKINANAIAQAFDAYYLDYGDVPDVTGLFDAGGYFLDGASEGGEWSPTVQALVPNYLSSLPSLNYSNAQYVIEYFPRTFDPSTLGENGAAVCSVSFDADGNVNGVGPCICPKPGSVVFATLLQDPVNAKGLVITDYNPNLYWKAAGNYKIASIPQQCLP